jgi:predicted nucleic acid-binding Zn ribbon protein
VLPPVYTIAYRDAAFVTRRASVKFWTAFHPHRDVTTGLGISTLLHLALFVFIVSALYEDGQDNADVPELAVQLETREGPNDEEFTEAAMPLPAPEPVEDVIDDPGSSLQTFDAPAVANHVPLLEHAPEMTELANPAQAQIPPDAGTVITTAGASEHEVAMIAEPAPKAVIADVSQPEKEMLAKNVQQLAQKLLDSERTDTELTWEQDGQQYQARVMRQPASDSTGIEQVVAEIMTHKDGKRMKTRLSLKRLAFSHFTQLVNSWDRGVQLHDDVIDGRFHSNSEINFLAGQDVAPRFFGKVTTAASRMSFQGFNKRRNRDVFQGGYETRTERVSLPHEMPEIVNGGEQGDRRLFQDDTRIIFNADGSYAWRLANGNGELHRDEPSQRPRYLIGEKGARLYVRGTVSGIFTVYSPHDIEIEDDLVYGKDPRQSVSSRDFLALISGRDITIAGPEVTGSGDLTVHGALFARRRFVVEAIERGGTDQTLVIYGSVTAGSISATEPRYATQIDFDKRFEYLRPASFPMTRRYEVDDWNHDWQEVDHPGDSSPESLAHSQ